MPEQGDAQVLGAVSAMKPVLKVVLANQWQRCLVDEINRRGMAPALRVVLGD